MSRQRFSSYLVIENWSVEDVEQFLEKNGFGECCGAFKKREIDGHAFLALTEGHLMLWKRELSMVNIRKLSKLIQELAQQPEKYVFSDSMKNGTTTPTVKTHPFSTFKPQTSNPSSLQLPRGTLVSLKNATGDVASIVSNMEFGSKHSVNYINSSCNIGMLAKNCNLHVKQPVFQQNRNSETSSSGSDNCSWDTNFSDDEAPSYLATSDTEPQCNDINKLATSKSTSEKADIILSQLSEQESHKPPAPRYLDFYPRRNTSETNGITSPRPANQDIQKQPVPQLSDVSPSRSAMPGEPPPVQIVRKLPAPPIQQLQNPQHLKELVSRLNISAAVEKAVSEQWDEEEQYESIDNENLPSREAIAVFTQNSSSQLSLNSQRSSSQLSLNSQKSPSQLSLSSPQDLTEEKSILSPPCLQNKLQNGWSQQFERRTNSQTEPTQLLERNSLATTSHQPPVPPLSKRPPPALPITSRPLPPQPVSSPCDSRSSSFGYRQPSSMADQEEEQYESVDGHAPQHADDGNLSDEYESIKDNTKVLCGAPQAGDMDYYLQPLAKQNSCEPAHPPVPPKPAVSIDIPSLEPPSPPVRLPEDLGNTYSSPGNSGDGVSGLIGELLRKVRNKPSSTPSTLEKEKTPTAEVKKPPLLPPPEHKPPPPVDRPPAYQNNQRPLPPTPESSKLSLSAKEQSNTGNRRGSRSTAITQMPWYHNVDRKKADELVRNSQDGMFLLRPSSQTQNPLSLTLWYNNRIYNISVRHRPDGKYALGYEKPNEQSFTSIEELVANYQSENLVLYSNGERTGRTLLTGWPPRRE